MSVLSSQQVRVLKWLLNCVRFAEQHNRQLLEDGFPWNPKTQDKERENCWRASLCRALARLEKRGLITRIKGRKKARTSRVKLTECATWQNR
jgi:hypothetical protein